MQNICTIGDIHGTQLWKQIDPSKYDLIIFLGDYLDSFDYSDKVIVHNFMDIIQFKRDNPDKVILLLGNHDCAYSEDWYRCSGYRASYAFSARSLLQTNKDLFQFAHVIGDYIFSHAGIVRSWYNTMLKQVIETGFIPNSTRPDLELADLYNTSKAAFLGEVGPVRGGYGAVRPGPLWADKSELIQDPLPGWNQIVGHSRVKEITEVITKDSHKLVFCDVLETTKKFIPYELII